MPKIKNDYDFCFTNKDFQCCTHSRINAQYLHKKFKLLKTSIVNTELFKHEFIDFKGRVCHPYNRGYPEFNNYHWIGFTHNKFEKPQNELQFQVTISHDEPFHVGIFVDKVARKARKKIKHNIEKNKSTFLKLLKEIPNYIIGYTGKDELLSRCKDIDETKLAKMIQRIDRNGIHFFIRQIFSKNDILKLQNHVVSEIVYHWYKLKPLYYLLAFGETNIIKSKEQILRDEVLNEKKRRHFSNFEIDLNESEADATERLRKQITYEQNCLAQERASSSHKKTIKILANYLAANKLKPQKSVIDIFAENGDSVFLFEIKSIHNDNSTFQTRMAIGQLLCYEYFEVMHLSQTKDKQIFKGIVYSKPPQKEYVDFLENYDFSVFWIEQEKLTGSINSLKKIKKFMSKSRL